MLYVCIYIYIYYTHKKLKNQISNVTIFGFPHESQSTLSQYIFTSERLRN